ncbi:Na(+)-translocating NADH-quinone reductase subunit C [Litoribrevibacter albus]|uniref:Na(+)-translocating NADH-quinone reductase subunit C n=1 Tax=Litoribrevibacter albus TaxID=1473156 RepID=A0AA37S8U0_9GAMM|nr:Na(+)-translocating NADH-quinone reductase subunit C [Litoribrevibacter albus]GLQ30303.1 Na(+)-translocating NADH-quinone reductase subunit C [Litoribrevibacter albus]
MSSNNDTIGKTITVALLLCIVCSVVVSGAAILLKPEQVANKALDMQRNILAIGGLAQPGESLTKAKVEELFGQIEQKYVDLNTGKFTDAPFPNYDQVKATKDPKFSEVIPADQDISSLKRKANVATVYKVVSGESAGRLILPVSGYGLWSTLYGFVALESDLNTVAGLGFYSHSETPGLGGEVDNPRWKKMWIGKKIYDESGNVAAKVKKGMVNPDVAVEKQHQVDGLSGATLTSKGVSNLIKFWLGDNGFASFLKNYKAGEA